MPFLCRSHRAARRARHCLGSLRRRVVPRARDAGAPRTARPPRSPGKSGPACVRAQPRREAELCPCLAMPRHDPHHGLTVRGDPATRPRRRVRVAAKPLGHFPEHPPDARHTHWPSLTHTATLSPSCTGSGSHTRSGGRLTSGSRLSGEAQGTAPWARVVGERERGRGDGRPVRLSWPTACSQPTSPSRPTEPQAELAREAKPSLVGPIEPAQPL
jgi:hypothetical protein